MEKTADLHVHTHLSDGTFTPKEVVENAVSVGLSCIAITDHDCVDGIESAKKAARKFDLEVVPGVEMTAQENGVEVHILGFFPDIGDKRFLEKLKAICQNRVERVYKIVEKLKKFNIELDPERIFELSGPGSVGRMHIAAILEEKGYVASINEAFKRFLSDRGPCYVPHYEISAKDAIRELKRVGAVTVFAHPNLMGGEMMVPKFVKYGLDGLEAYHSEHSKAVAKKYIGIAKEYGLIVTGGSDCHGLNKGHMLMGTVKVPYSLVEELKICAKKTKNT